MKPQRHLLSLVLALVALPLAAAHADGFGHDRDRDHGQPGYPGYPNPSYPNPGYPNPGYPTYPDNGGIQRLAQAAQQLNYVVSWSGVSPLARQLTLRLQEITPGINPQSLREAIQIVSQLDRELYDTQFHQPEIFRDLQLVQQALQSVEATLGYGVYPSPYPGNGYPGNGYPPAQQLRAAGLIDSVHYEFYGDRNSIFNQCLNFVRYNRITAPRNLIVNGQDFGGGYFQINQACGTVSQYAR